MGRGEVPIERLEGSLTTLDGLELLKAMQLVAGRLADLGHYPSLCDVPQP